MSLKGSRTLVQLGAGALRNTSKTTPILRRSFAQSSQRLRYGPVPRFENLSSPELEGILANLREKIIMPAHLTQEQRELIYKQRHHKSLITDPIVATLDGEEFTLKPIDRRVDLPRLKPSLYQAINLMKTRDDWENLPRLLEGLRHAGLRMRHEIVSMVAKKAGNAGRTDIILACARQGEATGFLMNHAENVRTVVWSFQLMAVNSGFDAEVTKKALAWSEQIFEMIELPTHIGKGFKGDSDPRVDPSSVGVLLELAAARASKHLGGKDVDGKVAKYAERLSKTSLDFSNGPLESDGAFASLWVSQVLPSLYGMRVAVKMLDPASEVVKKLQVASDSLKEEVENSVKRIPEVNKVGKVPHSLELYKTLSKSF